jgi:3-phenylpropionate/trans-cinnamate dioxygenase ferredoxin reductase subunit
MSENHCVIVGGSHAAAQLLSSLRLGGWKDKITMVSADGFLPYHRPPLSKSYLAGEKVLEEIMIRPPHFYDKSDADVRLNTRATRIDRDNKKLYLDDQTSIEYSKLILTTGAKVRKITVPGHNLPGVFYLRDLNDVDHIREFIGHVEDVVIIGGGYIGLEAASALKELGKSVTVLEAMPRVLQRVTAPEVSAFYTRVHSEEGVNIVTDAAVESIDGKDKVEGVTTADGRTFKAQMIIVGIGVIPDIELAENAGLEVNNGVVVDEFGRTSDPDILAAGDCTQHYNPIYDINLRLESVQNATDQSRVVANTILGKLQPYRALPWFWSDQYDLKLQIAGLSAGFDQVVIRGSTETGRSFAAFYYKEGKLIAVDAINRSPEFMAVKMALTKNLNADPTLVADESVDIQEIFKP